MVAQLARLTQGARAAVVPVICGPMAYTAEDYADQELQRRSGINRLMFENKMFRLESLIPEVTITADGVYWHPVSADHDDQLVTADIFPLAEAIREVQRRFTEQRAHASAAAQWFRPCS